MTDTQLPKNDELKPCPFCGAGKAMLYKITGKDVHGFDRPELFCDACKGSVYFEDSTSTGVDDAEDLARQNEKLISGWNARDTKMLEYVIGEDESQHPNDPYMNREPMIARNNLKNKQRERAKQWQKGEL